MSTLYMFYLELQEIKVTRCEYFTEYYLTEKIKKINNNQKEYYEIFAPI